MAVSNHLRSVIAQTLLDLHLRLELETCGASSLHSPDIAQASMVALKLTLKGCPGMRERERERDGSR